MSVPRKDLQSCKAASNPKNSDGTWSDLLPSHATRTAIGDEFILSAQTVIRSDVPINNNGIIKCQTCDLYFKQCQKPQYNEIEFRDGDLHCDRCYNRIVDEKAAAWKIACPSHGGILSTKKKFKRPISLTGQVHEQSLPLVVGNDGAVSQRHSQQQTRFSPGMKFDLI